MDNRPEEKKNEYVRPIANFIWQVADLLRGEYKRAEYGKIILPFTLLRRFDSVLKPTRDEVKEKYEQYKDSPALDTLLNRITNVGFHNTSNFDLEQLYNSPATLKEDFVAYIHGFSKDVREIFVEHFDFASKQIDKLHDANLLYRVLGYFLGKEEGTENSLLIDKLSNMQMGYLFEELIRKFAEESNETAGEHFTPREVVRLMSELIFIHDTEIFKDGVIKTVYDCAVAQEECCQRLKH